METDAYGAFIPMDQEAIQPLFSFGLVGGTGYADLADTPTAHFRHGLEVLKRSVAFFKSRDTTFVAHLGDVLAAENAPAGTQFTALQSIEAERARMGGMWHFTPGPSDLACFGPEGLTAALKPSRDAGARTYYVTFPCVGWRVLVLNAFETSTAASGIVAALGDDQLRWVQAQLSVAESANERVIVLSHTPLSTLADGDLAVAALAARTGVVASSISLAAAGAVPSHSTDQNGVHHIALCAASGLEVNEDSYGVVEVMEDAMRLHFVGVAPDGGWPSELFLRRAGKLVTSEASGFGLMSLVHVWLYIISTILTPLQPMLRLLGSSTAPADDAGGTGGAGSTEGEDVADSV